MAKKIDKPSKEVDKLTKKLFKGKEGKKFRQDIIDYLRGPNPGTGAGFAGAQSLVDRSQGLINQAISSQQSVLPGYQQAVQQGLAGQMYDIGPQQAFAERALRQETIPLINQSFATMGTPLSSDTTGQITGAVRDTYLDLAAQEALMNFQAQQALATGGANQFFNAAQQPANLALGGASQMSDLDAAFRATQQSTQPGAATLFPSFITGGLEPMSQISSRGRAIEEV